MDNHEYRTNRLTSMRPHQFLFLLLFSILPALPEAGAGTIYYTYDSLGRVTQIVKTDSLRKTYSYDTVGNLIQREALASSIPNNTPKVVVGIYQGLALSGNDTLGDSLLKLTIGTGSSFTGTLNFHGTIYQLKGAFVAGEGGVFVWNGSIHRTGQPDLIVSLRFDPSDPSGAITGTLSDDTDSATIALSRAGFDAKHPAALAGNYTVLLPANPDFPGDPYPQGDGYALLSVTAAGSVRLTGKLGDGSVITQSAPLSSDGRFAVHLPLYKNRGVLAGWVDFQPVDDVSDFNGTLHWTKSDTAGGPLYATGFDLEVDLMGSRFVPPVAGHRILNLENSPQNGVIFLGEGNFGPSLNFPATLLASNVVQTAATTPKAFKFTITPSTGFFSGSFLHPATNKAAVFSGVVFQKQNLATGYFPGSDKSGYVSLHRTATSALLFPPAGVTTPSNEITHPPFRGTRWLVEDGGNGHYYEVVTETAPIAWQDARDAAIARGGHLVTITSAAENTFVTTLLNGMHALAGAFQPSGSPEPAGGWQWVTGEPFEFTNWNDTQPDNYQGNENYLEVYPGPANNWNDLSGEALNSSYMVEYE